MINTYDEQIANPDYFRQLSVRDLLFVHYRCPQMERLEQLHNHYNQFTFSLKGERILHQGGKLWKVTPETSYFQRKTAYVQEITDSEGWEVLVFHIPDEFLVQFANEFMDNLPIEKLPELTNDMFIKIELSEITRSSFYSMLPYFRQKRPPSEKLLELKFKEILLSILSNPSNKQLVSYILHLSDDIKTPIWQIMEKNYTYNLTLKEYARISSRSLAAFKREFFEYYNTTPGKWLSDKRLNHARMLLITTKQNITEVAFNSGFENISHFSRIFKEKTGVSPLQFRKRQIAVA
jgi:AraC-like DNA-binding protein